MVAISTTQARSHLPSLIDDVRVKDEVVLLSKQGKAVAAIISMKKLQELETFEDEYWSKELRKAMQDGRLMGTEKTAQWLKRKGAQLEI